MVNTTDEETVETVVIRVVSILEKRRISQHALELLKVALQNCPTDAIRIQGFEFLAARLQSSPAALSEIIGLLPTSVISSRIIATLLAGEEPRRAAFKTFLRSSAEHALPTIKAAIAALNTGDNDLDRYSCHTLGTLVRNHKANARAAAKAGAIRRLLALLKRAGREHNHAMLGIGNDIFSFLIHGSTNRAKTAVSEGGLSVLADLIVPTEPLCEALFKTLTQLWHAAPPTNDVPFLKNLIAKLTPMLAHDSYSRDCKTNIAQLLYQISSCQEGLLRDAIGESLAEANAGPALVHLAAGLRPTLAHPPMCLLTTLLKERPGAAHAVVQAGGITAAREHAAARAPAAEEDDVRYSLLRASSQQVLMLLGLLYREARDAVRQLGGGAEGGLLATVHQLKREIEEVGGRAAAKQEARIGQCALCGARSGSGSGREGALLQCSSCMGVSYCGRDCQLAHWKVHKAECRGARKV